MSPGCPVLVYVCKQLHFQPWRLHPLWPLCPYTMNKIQNKKELCWFNVIHHQENFSSMDVIRLYVCCCCFDMKTVTLNLLCMQYLNKQAKMRLYDNIRQFRMTWRKPDKLLIVWEHMWTISFLEHLVILSSFIITMSSNTTERQAWTLQCHMTGSTGLHFTALFLFCNGRQILHAPGRHVNQKVIKVWMI